MVTLTIDGKTVSVPAGTTILEAARTRGIAIPTLCWLQKVSPTGACRICVVEVAGVDRPMTACNTPVKDGLVVTTQSDALREIRRQVVELLLINHPLDCPVCDAAGECDLQNLCYELDVAKQPYKAEDVNHDVINEWPLIQQVPSRCVLCEKCVKVCHETVGSSALFVNEKGDKAFIDKNVDLCEFCGSCVSVCPTGTMISKPYKFKARPWELTKVPSTCTLCPTQCQIDLNVKGNELCRVTSEIETTENNGNLCIGGFFGADYIHSRMRLHKPLVKDSGVLKRASWDEAIAKVADRLGPLSGDEVAGLSSPRLTNEENYLFQKLIRTALGSSNVDSEARFGLLRAIKVLNGTLGLQGASAPLEAIGKAGAVLVFGADVTAEAPGVDWQIEQACRKNDGKLVIAGMRAVKLNRYANSFLNYRPGTEVALINALGALLLKKGLVDEAALESMVENLAEVKAFLESVDVAKAAEQTGVSVELMEEAALYIGRASSVALVFGGDLTRSEKAEEKVSALVTLAALSGALQCKTGGIFPIDEKGNTQGLLDMGVCPEFLPGFRPNAGGKDALAILEGIEKKEIKALYLAGVNPLVSFPENARWRKALESLDFLVVQDILSNEVTDLADVVLPGLSFAEKDGTVTSLGHRISPIAHALTVSEEGRPDFEIMADIYGRLTRTRPSLASVRAEIAERVPGYAALLSKGGGVKPIPTAADKFKVEIVAAQEPSDGLKLVTGTIPFQFGTTTTYSAVTSTVAPEGYIAMSPADAEVNGLKEGDTVRVSSSVASLQGKVTITDALPKGLLFAPSNFASLNVQQIMSTCSNVASVQVVKA